MLHLRRDVPILFRVHRVDGHTLHAQINIVRDHWCKSLCVPQFQGRKSCRYVSKLYRLVRGVPRDREICPSGKIQEIAELSNLQSSHAVLFSGVTIHFLIHPCGAILCGLRQTDGHI